MDEYGGGWKQRMLQDFSSWLAALPDAVSPEKLAAQVQIPIPEVDLHTLFAELAALRQEIKLQNREQAKTARDFERLSATYEETISLFRTRSHELATLEERFRKTAQRQCLLPFLEVRDALVRGRDACAVLAKPRGLFRRRQPRGIVGVLEGYEMAIRRFDRVLTSMGVSQIQTVGEPFDPARMHAVDSRQLPGVQPGIVLEEHLSGFIQGDAILRLAEVVVSR
jgi:molecular chaperone GrpE (heat shock protein)